MYEADRVGPDLQSIHFPDFFLPLRTYFSLSPFPVLSPPFWGFIARMDRRGGRHIFTTEVLQGMTSAKLRDQVSNQGSKAFYI